MSAETVVAGPNVPSTTEGFAEFIGIDPALLNTDAPADEPPAEDATDDVVADDAAEVAAEDTADVTEDVTDDAPADEETAEDAEPVKLPFEAKANDGDVDAALLANMELTFKADGKDVTLPLADVVRRAQSEPAVQRQARALQAQMEQVTAKATQYEQEIASVREIALRMARDPNYYASVVAEVEGYDQPEARAERAEAALAASREKATREASEAERNARLQEFAVTEVAPVLDSITGNNPLVSPEEILGKFYADTASITVNGVIPPEQHAAVAQYLRTTLAEFAAQRQATYAKRDADAKAEALKTQRERQKLKNKSAQHARPVGQPNGLRDTPAASGAPRTVKEAEAGALATLLGGLS